MTRAPRLAPAAVLAKRRSLMSILIDARAEALPAVSPAEGT
jgi:hypothetical protein